MRRGRRALVGAFVTAAVLAAAACSDSPDPVPVASSATDAAPAPVSYPVPDGCPADDDLGMAYIGDASWYESLPAGLLDREVESPLPPEGCAYASRQVNEASSGSTYRVVHVYYFNLGESGKRTEQELLGWAEAAAPDGLDPANPRRVDLPTSFTGWTGSSLAVTGDDSTWFSDDEFTPAYTQGATGRIQFALGTDQIDALLSSVSDDGTMRELNGIIAIGGDTSEEIVLTGLAPGDGSVTGVRSFPLRGGAHAEIPFGAPHLARQAFDPALERVAAVRWDADDGSRHAGWVTMTGEFVDVSAALAPADSGFSSTIHHVSPRFGADGSFYFLDVPARVIVRVEPRSAEELGADAIEVVESDVRPGMFFVWPSGTVQACEGCIPMVEHLTPEYFGAGGRVQGWLDEHTLICAVGDTRLMLYDPYPAGASTTTSSCGLRGTDRPLLPDTDRLSWNAVPSPDGTSVAFLSSTATGTSPAELYVVERAGAAPTLVPTDHPFVRKGGAGSIVHHQLQVLDWR